MLFRLSHFPSEEETRELTSQRSSLGEDAIIALGKDFFRLVACQTCDAKFEVRISARSAHRPLVCATCTKREEEQHEHLRKQEAERAEQERRREMFHAAVPLIYRASELSLLPLAGLAAVDAYGPDDLAAGKGLGLIGPAGAGKTRCMGRLIGRLCMEFGVRVKSITATDFAHRVSALAYDNVSKLEGYIRELSSIAILFVDDVGKGRLTDRVEAEFYHVLEKRTSNARPTLWTSNANAEALLHMFSADRGEPIVRRLAEFSHTVNLSSEREYRRCK